MYNACQSFSLGQENDRAVRVQKISENGNLAAISGLEGREHQHALRLSNQVYLIALISVRICKWNVRIVLIDVIIHL